MKLNTYKTYKICPICGQELPYTRDYFKRSTRDGKENKHLVCRQCEDYTKQMSEWKDGKLLCHYCREYKDIEEFGFNGSNGSKIRLHRKTICKKCSLERQHNRNRNLDNNIKLHKCLLSRLLGARDRAKRNNIPFNITMEDLEDLWNKQNGLCALSGIQMTFELNNGRTPTNLSLDKINRLKGYTKDNIQLVCMACNQMKSDLSEDELYYFCQQIIKTYENKNKENSE